MFVVNLAVMWVCRRSVMLVVTYDFMSMRLPSTLLKSAVYLLLGFSTVFGGAAANALTFNWSIVSDAIGFGSGTFTTGDPLGTIYTITGISGSWTYNGIAEQISGLDTDFGRPSNTFDYSSDGSTLNVDSNGISFATDSGQIFNIYQGSQYPYGPAENATVFPNVTGASVLPDTSGSSINSAAAAPAPRPLLVRSRLC